MINRMSAVNEVAPLSDEYQDVNTSVADLRMSVCAAEDIKAPQRLKRDRQAPHTRRGFFVSYAGLKDSDSVVQCA